MLRKYWEVLLVDDEEDVLAISKIAVKGLECYGIPIKVHTCTSKKEAIEFLKKDSELAYNTDIAVAIIDVVMETDEAGLELCEYIRKDLDNWATQLVVRTGQAGKYPERGVIDRYEINGYLAKVDATETRL